MVERIIYPQYVNTSRLFNDYFERLSGDDDIDVPTVVKMWLVNLPSEKIAAFAKQTNKLAMDQGFTAADLSFDAKDEDISTPAQPPPSPIKTRNRKIVTKRIRTFTVF